MSKTITRILGKVTRTKSKSKDLLGVYEIPDDAMWMIQDICALEIMQQILDRLQYRSFTERRIGNYARQADEARKVLRRLSFLIARLKEVAEQNLMYDFLEGKKMPRREPRLTIADVWNLLMEGFGK